MHLQKRLFSVLFPFSCRSCVYVQWFPLFRLWRLPIMRLAVRLSVPAIQDAHNVLIVLIDFIVLMPLVFLLPAVIPLLGAVSIQ